jgi:hypothetical protein
MVVGMGAEVRLRRSFVVAVAIRDSKYQLTEGEGDGEAKFATMDFASSCAAAWLFFSSSPRIRQ